MTRGERIVADNRRWLRFLMKEHVAEYKAKHGRPPHYLIMGPNTYMNAVTPDEFKDQESVRKEFGVSDILFDIMMNSAQDVFADNMVAAGPEAKRWDDADWPEAARVRSMAREKLNRMELESRRAKRRPGRIARMEAALVKLKQQEKED